MIGNGISRKDLDIRKLAGRGVIMACNKFISQYRLEDVPFYLGANDPDPLRMCRRSGIFETGKLMVSSNIIKRAREYFINQCIYCLHKPYETSTGHMVLYAALTLECYPIFLIGIGDPFEKVVNQKHEVLTDNMYHNGAPIRFPFKYRIYADERHQAAQRRIILHWVKNYQMICNENPDVIYRVGNTSALQIPYVNWSELLELPVQYRTEYVPMKADSDRIIQVPTVVQAKQELSVSTSE